MATYVSLVNELLRRTNDVTLDTAGDGFDTVRNVQALAKDVINNSVRTIVQSGQEWPFLKTTTTQTLTSGTNTYAFPSNYSSADWDTFYLKRNDSISAQPRSLKALSYEDYIQRHRVQDDNGAEGAPTYVFQTLGDSFGVTPVPNAAYEIEYTYWSTSTDMVNYNDVCVIPDRYKQVIIDGAMMYMMRFRSNEQSASIHQNQFEEGIKQMRRVELDDALYVRSTMIER